MNRINFILSTQKVISVNALYKAKVSYVGGRQVGTIYKSREAKMTEAYIKEQVDSLNVPVNYPWITKDTLFKMTVRIVFKSGVLNRDLDNTLFSFWGINFENCWDRRKSKSAPLDSMSKDQRLCTKLR